MIYDLDKNKVYVQGIEFDVLTSMEDIEIVLRRIQKAVEAKNAKKKTKEANAKKAKKNPDENNGNSSSSSTVRV